MKTAMQELLEWLENSSDVQNNILNWEIVKENAKEKEKEQIIDAHNNAVISPYTQLYVHKIQGKSPITKGEEYYNQTYNQNK